jgi:hypothetical protein
MICRRARPASSTVRNDIESRQPFDVAVERHDLRKVHGPPRPSEVTGSTAGQGTRLYAAEREGCRAPPQARSAQARAGANCNRPRERFRVKAATNSPWPQQGRQAATTTVVSAVRAANHRGCDPKCPTRVVVGWPFGDYGVTPSVADRERGSRSAAHARSNPSSRQAPALPGQTGSHTRIRSPVRSYPMSSVAEARPTGITLLGTP